MSVSKLRGSALTDTVASWVFSLVLRFFLLLNHFLVAAMFE